MHINTIQNGTTQQQLNELLEKAIKAAQPYFEAGNKEAIMVIYAELGGHYERAGISAEEFGSIVSNHHIAREQFLLLFE